MSGFGTHNSQGRLLRSSMQLLYNRENIRTGSAPATLDVISKFAPGLHQIILDDPSLSNTGSVAQPGAPGRWPLFFVPPPPSSSSQALPSKLLIYYHGAGDNAINGKTILPSDVYENSNIYMLFMASHGTSWDGIRKGFGPDLLTTDLVLSRILYCHPHITDVAIGGFSDGASYAIGVGLANIDLFSHILAWSPGFIVPSTTPLIPDCPQPKCFISHGTNDNVLNIDRCSRRIVTQLRGRGVFVNYKEFHGRHEIPRFISLEALYMWLNA